MNTDNTNTSFNEDMDIDTDWNYFTLANNGFVYVRTVEPSVIYEVVAVSPANNFQSSFLHTFIFLNEYTPDDLNYIAQEAGYNDINHYLSSIPAFAPTADETPEFDVSDKEKVIYVNSLFLVLLAISYYDGRIIENHRIDQLVQTALYA
jgi:hypothetical protein